MVLAWHTFELAPAAVLFLLGLAVIFRLCTREERVTEALERKLPAPKQSKIVDIVLFVVSLVLLIGGVLYGLHTIGYESYGSSGW